jgi:putative methyltransferase
MFRESINAVSNGSEDSAISGDGEASRSGRRHPRWIRVNTLRTTLQEQLSTTFAGYEQRDNLSEVIAASGNDKLVHVDQHIPNLLAFPPQCNLFKSAAYQEGKIIFQDKASCFPAYLLDFGREIEGDVIDACAAPGNKTTHLAAIGHNKRIIAFERNKQRTGTLKKMVALAGAEEVVMVRGTTDFLSTRPADFQAVHGILLDPSCSGSGIVGRDDEPQLFLPSKDAIPEHNGSHSKKRKRNPAVPVTESIQELEVVENEKEQEDEALADRLASLSAFQSKILDHAMHFPNATKIVYSTCSVHAEENEHVVVKALASDAAREFGWRILLRPAQVKGLREWDTRGDLRAFQRATYENFNALGKSIGVPIDVDQSNDLSEEIANDIANACIRCERGTSKGTMGFFVACFVRNTDNCDDVSMLQTISSRMKQLGGKDKREPGIAPDSATSKNVENKWSDNSADEDSGAEQEQGSVNHSMEEEWTGFSDDENVAVNDDAMDDDAMVDEEDFIEQKIPSPKQESEKKRKRSKKEKLKEVEKAGSWCR